MYVVCGIGSKYRNRMSNPGQSHDFGLDRRVLEAFLCLELFGTASFWLPASRSLCWRPPEREPVQSSSSRPIHPHSRDRDISTCSTRGMPVQEPRRRPSPGFRRTGVLGGPATISLMGDASGNLTSTVTILNGALNSSGYNDYNQALTFGTFTAFEVVLSDPVGGTANSGFALSFYASDDGTPVLSTDPSGASALLTVEPDGTVMTRDLSGRWWRCRYHSHTRVRTFSGARASLFLGRWRRVGVAGRGRGANPLPVPDVTEAVRTGRRSAGTDSLGGKSEAGGCLYKVNGPRQCRRGPFCS
jgi:hypothetical protein